MRILVGLLLLLVVVGGVWADDTPTDTPTETPTDTATDTWAGVEMILGEIDTITAPGTYYLPVSINTNGQDVYGYMLYWRMGVSQYMQPSCSLSSVMTDWTPSLKAVSCIGDVSITYSCGAPSGWCYSSETAMVMSDVDLACNGYSGVIQCGTIAVSVPYMPAVGSVAAPLLRLDAGRSEIVIACDGSAVTPVADSLVEVSIIQATMTPLSQVVIWPDTTPTPTSNPAILSSGQIYAYSDMAGVAAISGEAAPGAGMIGVRAYSPGAESLQAVTNSGWALSFSAADGRGVCGTGVSGDLFNCTTFTGRGLVLSSNYGIAGPTNMIETNGHVYTAGNYYGASFITFTPTWSPSSTNTDTPTATPTVTDTPTNTPTIYPGAAVRITSATSPNTLHGIWNGSTWTGPLDPAPTAVVQTSDNVHQMPIFIPGTYADDTTDNLIQIDTGSAFTWRGPPAYLVDVRARHVTDDGTSQPKIDVMINGSATLDPDLTVGTAWASAGQQIQPTAYGIVNGGTVELAVKTAAGEGTSEDLTVLLTFKEVKP